MNIKEMITFWVPLAILVVIGRRIIDYGFNKMVFGPGFIGELFMGVIVCIVVITLLKKKESK